MSTDTQHPAGSVELLLSPDVFNTFEVVFRGEPVGSIEQYPLLNLSAFAGMRAADGSVVMFTKPRYHWAATPRNSAAKPTMGLKSRTDAIAYLLNAEKS